MPKTTKTKTKTTISSSRPKALVGTPVVISMGCPSGIGPEVALKAALLEPKQSFVLVGDSSALHAAALHAVFSAQAARSARAKKLPLLQTFDPAKKSPLSPGIHILEPCAPLSPSDRLAGKPTALGGAAQLAYIEAAYALSKERGWPLATGPVSKEVIAHSGLRRARGFRGHTEWLEALDGASHSVMCFASKKLVTSLATTHVPIAKLSRLLSADLVTKATLELLDLLLRMGYVRPRIAVCSLNPHAGEGELLGQEERTAIIPGIARAREICGRRGILLGPIGAETAYRKGASGAYEGVVAMYHDQATIPMKLLDFGGAVNVTQGLSIVRTSVDHGTAYDIAGKGIAEADGMSAAVSLARVLGQARRRIALGSW